MYNIHEKDCYGDKRKWIVKKKKRTDRQMFFPWIIFILINTVFHLDVFGVLGFSLLYLLSNYFFDYSGKRLPKMHD